MSKTGEKQTNGKMDCDTQEEEEEGLTLDLVVRLIDSIDFECRNWEMHQLACTGINDLADIFIENSLDNQLHIDRVLEYLERLIGMCDNGDTVLSAINAIRIFPLSKLEPFLIKLLSANQFATQEGQWPRNVNILQLMYYVLKEHLATLDKKVIGLMFDHFPTEHTCEKEQITKCEVCSVNEFLLPELQLLFPQLIDSMELDMERDLCDWTRHQNFGLYINAFLIEYPNLLDDKLIDQLFDYCTKLMLKCENPKLISFVLDAIAQFPLRKLETSLPNLLCSMECELNSEECKWFRHQNMSVVIQNVLSEHKGSLDVKIIDGMFDYCSKVVHHCDKTEQILFAFGAFPKFTLDKLHSSLPQMIDLIDNELNGEECQKWFRHENMSAVILGVLDVHRDVLNETTLEQMSQYLTKLILKCEDRHLISYSFSAFKAFPLNKLEPTMLKLIKRMENQLENSSVEEVAWHGHGNFCKLIQILLGVFRDSQQTLAIERMFDYLTKLIYHCDKTEQILLAFGAFPKFTLDKLHASLPQMIDLIDNELNGEECQEWFRHQNMSEVIFNVLDKFRDSLHQAVINQMFEYLSELIMKSENEDTASIAANAFKKFPIGKLETSLPSMIGSLKSDLETHQQQSKWTQHDSMCWVIDEVLKEYRDSLHQAVINQMFEYLSELIMKSENEDTVSIAADAFKKFPIGKLETSLPSMIGSLKSDLETHQQQSKWTQHDNMCWVIDEVLKEYRDSLNKAVIDQMFEYITELIFKCPNEDLISLSVFGTFPLSKLQSSLPQLIRSMEDQLESGQCTQWFKHRNMGSALQFVLHEHSLDQTVLDQICDYCTKLVHKCENGQLIEYALGVLPSFPPSKRQTVILQLISPMEDELDSGHCTEWFKHENVCLVLQDVLDWDWETLSQELIHRMFDYITKLLIQPSSEIILKEAWITFKKIPLNQIENFLFELIKSTEPQLNTEQQAEWKQHENVSGLIEAVLKVHRNSLDPVLIDRMFEYCTKLVRNRQVQSAISALKIIKQK